MKPDYSMIADITELAAMSGISFECAKEIFLNNGWDGVKRVLKAGRA